MSLVRKPQIRDPSTITWAQHQSETRQRISVEQREFEAGFDAGWWKRGLDNEGEAVAALKGLVEATDRVNVAEGDDAATNAFALALIAARRMLTS